MTSTSKPLVFDRSGVDALIAKLAAAGYRVIGPIIREGVVVYGDLGSTADLPVGRTDRQGPGEYALEARDDEALFGYVVGPHSPKQYLHPPEVTLWSGTRTNAKFRDTTPDPPPPMAFFGVRPCELAAIAVQDRVFMDGPDVVYGPRREQALVVTVNCTEPGGTCFCVSMDTGPRARTGYDIALTEVLGGDHHFLAEPGSQRGEELLAGLDAREAAAEEVATVDELLTTAAAHMGRSLETEGLPELMFRNLEHPRWEAVAERCLACANCTMVCPTCFCSAVEDGASLDGTEAVRVRVWDSCFNDEFSYLHGSAHRDSGSARYRQWLTHKLASWWDQFGTSGCVGCGRCITWCPVGIDITEEAAAIRAEEAANV